MAGGNHKGSSAKPPPYSSGSSSHRKSRWELSTSSSAGKQPLSAAVESKAAPSESKLAPAAKSSSHKPPSNKPSPKRGSNNPNPSPSGPKQHKPQQDVNPPRSSTVLGSGPPPRPALFPLPDHSLGPPPPPSYGFHMLDRRNIVLADGSVRSYFALPPDYQDFVTPPRPHMDLLTRFGPMGPDVAGPGRFPPMFPMSPGGFQGSEDHFGRNRSQDYWNSLGLDGRGAAGSHEGLLKRKYGEEEEKERDRKDEFARQRQQLLQYGNVGANLGARNMFTPGTSSPFTREDGFRSSKMMRIGGGADKVGPLLDVDPVALKKAFLHYAKAIHEQGNHKKYLENGKHGPLKCLVCRSTEDFPDVHALIMHAYSSDKADSRVDHLGFHKAICVLMGWNYAKAPDNSRVYQFLPAGEVVANQEDLIMWPPMVMIFNTSTGKGKDGRIEGLGNKFMDKIIRGMGFSGGKPKTLYSREGHLGITLIRFSPDHAGLKEAIKMGEHFEKENHGRRGWARIQQSMPSGLNENHPEIAKVDERTGEKERVFYGHVATVADLDKLDFETRKKVVIESRREYLQQFK